ncbi:MAG: M14 family zinc carboxypeptidase [Thermoplasmatota archaeon]
MDRRISRMATCCIVLLFIAGVFHGVEASRGRTGWYKKPDSYGQLVGWYQALEQQHPGYLEVFKANELYDTGRVAGGYDCWYVRITNESRGLDKPEVLFLGGPHGDETVGTISAYWFTDWLMRHAPGSAWLRWLIDHREIYIEISHNPYGYDNGQRTDSHGWDLNREADYDGPGGRGPPTCWESVPGRTLVRFVNNHSIRVGTDFHGGVRMLLYPWGSTHTMVKATSPISGKAYWYAPPDFYFYDAASLRLGSYMGDYGGDLNADNVGPIPETVGYPAAGSLAPWAYGADVARHPAEEAFVNLSGGYPGAGIMWISPELSVVKDPPQWKYGGDIIPGYGIDTRRYMLHQVDLAQPYLRWKNPPERITDSSVTLQWQVNGSLVVDHTMLQWSTNPDVIEHPMETGVNHDDYQGKYLGGTGWDDARNGRTSGVTWQDTIQVPPGASDLYVVARAQVDQVYGDTLAPETYGSEPYLRLVQERTNASYHETINGTDGVETIQGQTWWYSDVLHLSIGGIDRPRPGMLYVNDQEVMPLPRDIPIIFGDVTVETQAPGADMVSIAIDGETMATLTEEPWQWTWTERAFGRHTIEVTAQGDTTASYTRDVWIANLG